MGLPTVDSVGDVLVRLASEGIPVRAIARCTCVPSADIYERLTEAVESGELLEVPRADWPAGVARVDRTPVFKSLLETDDGTLLIHIVARFRITRLQAILLLALLKRPTCTRDHLFEEIERRRPQAERSAGPKITDVSLWGLRRKLRPLLGADAIITVRTSGYLMPHRHRQRVLEMLGEQLGMAA
jgi:hypothetical protein